MQDCDEETAPVLQTIFSPTFHVSKVAGGDIASGGRWHNIVITIGSNVLILFFRSGDQKSHKESEMEYSLVDMWDGHVTQEISEYYSESTFTSINATCHGSV